MNQEDAQAFLDQTRGLVVRSIAVGAPPHVIGIELASAGGAPEEVAWYLGVESAWRLESAIEVLTCWQDAATASERMRAELQALSGGVVAAMKVVAPAFDLDFWFADGKRLMVFADTRDELPDQRP
jgi:hypothetical protein